MNALPAGLPAAGVLWVIGPEDAGTGFLVSGSGLIVTCAHVLAGCAPGATVQVEPHAGRRPLDATVDLLQDPPDVAVLRLAGPVPAGAQVLPLGRSPGAPRPGLRTFGYPQVRAGAGLPGELAFLGVTADGGYEQLVLRSEEATLGFSGAPVWDPDLGAVVGMVKSIVRRDPGGRLGDTAFGVPAEVIRGLCPELRLPAACPYRGLEPFTEEHADYYYGREHAAGQLLASLAARDFVPVVAVSGGGKSSLLQAGLAKGLRDTPTTALAQRARCYQRAGRQPHAGLLSSLAQSGTRLPPELAGAPPRELAAAICAAAPPAGLIVVADQYERLYTDCGDADRKRFTELLLLLATGTVKVVIGLRADFYDLALADLGERLAAGQVVLAPMTEQDLRRAVTEPARKLLRSFQPGLARQITADVLGRPGELPLLQFALTQLWEHDAAGGVLTRATYQGLGELPGGERLPGAQGALIARAEQLWLGLSPDDRGRLQRILLGLIAARPAGTGADGRAGSQRDFSRPALLTQWDASDRKLIRQLVSARLLTADRDTVEVSHEVLLRAWPRLRAWLEDRAELVQWRARDLSPNLERWLNNGKSPGFLLPRPLLDPALRWLEDYPDELNGPPADYIRASGRHRTRRRRLAAGGVAVLVAASLAAAAVFLSLQQAAARQLMAADASLMIVGSQAQADTDPVLSSLLSVAAWHFSPSSAAWYAMVSAAARRQTAALAVGAGINSIAFGRDGKTLATIDGDGVVRLWDVATRKQAASHTTRPAGSLFGSVALSRNGKTLATMGGDAVWLWDVATRQPAGSSITVPGATGSGPMAFSPDGKTLATVGGDGVVWFWDLATRKPAGRSITVPGGTGFHSMAFSQDGKTLATMGEDGVVRLWSVATRKQAASLITGPADSLFGSVAFRQDDKTLATTGFDGVVRLWDVAAGRQVASTTTVPGSFWVAFSPDGKTLATSSADGTAELWNVAMQDIGSPITVAGDPGGSAFSQDGKTLATFGREGGPVRLWNVATREQIGAINDPGGSGFSSVAPSQDGKTLATLDADGPVRLWNVATREQIGAINDPSGKGFISVALSQDGKILVTGSFGGTAGLWNVATQQQIGSTITVPGAEFISVAFSLDGKTLATGGYGGTVQLWDVATQQQIGSTITVPGAEFISVALSPDGKTLATGSYGGTVQLWDVATQQQIGSTITDPPGGEFDSVAFSQDGKTLATMDSNGTVDLWDVAYLADPVSDLCASAGRSLTRAEWARYAPGLAYQSTCPGKE